jgi:hypothetical protein
LRSIARSTGQLMGLLAGRAQRTSTLSSFIAPAADLHLVGVEGRVGSGRPLAAQ